ncbi:MAG TPA: TetR/AcrR family transcriptional regulator [Solirubrobacterales bacterium]|nr:TetR/AcrR family transcriptional regulator [Solirubrobacterales bacterium]
MASTAEARTPRSARKRRSDGERSRTAILDEAARLATVEGIGGLSLGRLADAVGMSKSGLFAHFGSKEELQLATIETADSIFETQVLEPSSEAEGGLERLRALLEGYLSYVESGTFPGGCFFASVLVEVSMQPGAVRDRLLAFLEDWLGRLEQAVRDAQREGTIAKGEEPAQLAFELEAALLLANTQFSVAQNGEPIERGRRAIDRRLKEAAA